MSAEFVDTNILIYANDRSAGAKRATAADLLMRLNNTDDGALSLQVLSEFFNATTKKRLLTDAEALGLIWDYSCWSVHVPSVQHLMEAAALRSQYRLSWYDALILNSALQLGCATLWTEDFSHGQQFGSLTVRNPFQP